jgi:hypothetical protein
MQLVNPQTPVKSIAYIVMAVLGAVIVGAEPLATALVQLFIAFGGSMTPEQTDALITVVRIVAQLLVTAGVVQIAANRQSDAVTPVANPTLPADSVVNVQGTEDKVVIAASPPGPIGYDGGAAPPTG